MTFTCPGCTFDCPGAWSVTAPDYCSCCELALPAGTFCKMLADEKTPRQLCVKMMEKQEETNG